LVNSRSPVSGHRLQRTSSPRGLRVSKRRRSWCGPITIFHGTIIEPVKDRRPQRSPSVWFVLPGHEGQFERGDNYITILQWHPVTRAYRVMSRTYFALVRDGRLTDGDRRPIADVLSGLRSISQ